MINILLHSTIFRLSLIKMYLFAFLFFSMPRPFYPHPLPPQLDSFKSNIMWVYKSANEFVCLLPCWSLKLADEGEKRKKENFMDGEGHWWGNGLFTLVHFIGAFIVFCPIHQRPRRGPKKGKKGHPHVWRVIIFLMTVSSGKNGSDPRAREREGNCGRCTVRFISRHVLREGIRHSREGPADVPSAGIPKEQQTSVYNYQLHPFLWDKIRSLGQGIIFLKGQGKKEKGMNGCAKVYWPQVSLSHFLSDES